MEREREREISFGTVQGEISNFIIASGIEQQTKGPGSAPLDRGSRFFGPPLDLAPRALDRLWTSPPVAP